MNITHAVKEEVIGDRLEAIFERQKELMAKYHDIEIRSGLLQTPDVPVNLDDKRGQARIKDFAWRITEELGEALDAHSTDWVHFNEELIDGLHFLTEMSILCGQSPMDILENAKKAFHVAFGVKSDILGNLAKISLANYDNLSFEGKVTKFVECLGMTCNCLKNKPWKQSNMITDKEMFYKNLSKVWVVYISILNYDMSLDDVVEVYLKKSQVNKFRQRSNY